MPSSERELLGKIRHTAHNSRKHVRARETAADALEDSLAKLTHEVSEGHALSPSTMRSKSNPGSPSRLALPGFEAATQRGAGRSAPATGRSILHTGRSRVNDPDYYNSWVQKARNTGRGERKPAYGSFYKGGNDSLAPGSYDVAGTAGRDAAHMSMGKRLRKHAEFIEKAEEASRLVPAPGTYDAGAGAIRRDKAHAFGGSNRCLTPESYAKRQAMVKCNSRSRFQMAAKSTFVPTSRGAGVGVTATALKKSPSFGFGASRRF